MNEQSDQIEFAAKARDHSSKMAEQAEGAVNRFVEQERNARVCTEEVAVNMKHALDKSLNARPMPTLALAAAAGFFLRAIWKT